MEDLSKGGNDEGRRDYIYYLAIANAKIKVIKMIILLALEDVIIVI